MANYLTLIFLMVACFLTAQAQPYNPSTVQKLDELEQTRILLSKEIEVAKLQAELQKANEEVGLVTGTGAASSAAGAGSSLRLIKVAGLASKPEAVFLYGGYRIVAEKGKMVIPNIQMTSVTQSYVVLKDITSGKESILWLSSADKSQEGTNPPGPNNPNR